jgi:general secretion pathway protein A
MYLSHYNLDQKPFEITTDPAFIWLGEKHTEALATLEYGIQENKGFLLLTGDVGTGKTLLINSLLKRIGDEVVTAKVSDPGLDNLDFYNFLSQEFLINKNFNSKGGFLLHLKHFLHEAHQQNKKVLLIIDEAQNLKDELLEEIRLLSNIELDDAKLINIFFVGQNEIKNILSKEKNRAVRQRISIRYHINPLFEFETHDYIFHRLDVAGSENKIFNSEAIKKIYSFSSGFPRLINIICDHALMTGYSLGLDTIDEKIVEECAQELNVANESLNFKNDSADIVKKLSQLPQLKNKNLVWRWFNLAATILILFIISGFVISNLYSRNHEQSQTSKLALKNYKRYEQAIENIKKNQLPSMKPGNESSLKTKVQVGNKSKISSSNNFVIYFENNSKKFSSVSLKTLEKLEALTSKYPNSEIIIKGYTDSHGNYWYNQKVSKARADLVKNFLTNRGIISSKIKAIGMGSENPIDTNVTKEGRKKNRRVEIKIQILNPNLI